MKPNCVKFVSFDRRVYVCAKENDNNEGETYAEDGNLEIIIGYCKSCIEKFKMDSIRGTNYELMY